MTTPAPAAPAEVVQRQLEAYNARDLEAWIATYAPDAEQHVLHGELLQRIAMGALVIDHERVSQVLPEGPGTVEMLCLYEVEGLFIRRASFAIGPATLLGR